MAYRSAGTRGYLVYDLVMQCVDFNYVVPRRDHELQISNVQLVLNRSGPQVRS